MDQEIIYVGDPMCSWCWGFSPVLQTINERFGERAPIRVVVGGLRAGDTQHMNAEMKAFVRHHWERVHEMTGQPFCFDLFDRDDVVMNTEPSCRAVVAMRGLRPVATLPFFERLHRAYYVDNMDMSSDDGLCHLATSYGVALDDFSAAFKSPAVSAETRDDFQLSQRLGVRGFPTIILRQGEALSMLTAGYQPFEALGPILDQWVTSEASAASQSKGSSNTQ